MPCTRPYAESYAFIQPHMQAIRAVLHPPTCDPRLHRGCPGPSDIAIHIRECPKTFSPRWPGCPRLSWARSNLRSYLLAILGRGNATATTAAAGLGPDHASSSSTIWVVASDKVKKECPALVDELMITYMDAATGRTRVRMRSSPDVMSDFAFLAAAPTVILTLQSVQVSSYGWWAALLGRATRVHMPLNLCTWPWWRAKFLRNGTADATRSASGASSRHATGPLTEEQPTAVFDQPERYRYHDLERGRYFGRIEPHSQRVVWPHNNP